MYAYDYINQQRALKGELDLHSPAVEAASAADVAEEAAQAKA